MDRRVELTKFITKEQRGIEVGPWFAPLVPKRHGYNSLSLDIFKTDELKQRAIDDPHVPRHLIPNIENVDLVGTSTEIEEIVSNAGLLGGMDYIISSHNFEHLPDPILFLRGCGRVLSSNGVLSMAIPDKRTCFDFFRPHSTLGDWLEAYFEHRIKPTYAQVFDQKTLAAVYIHNSSQHPGFSLADDTANLDVAEDLLVQYEEWKRKAEAHDQTYQDAHCWTFTPSSFTLLIRDLCFLGLCPLEIEEISEVNGHEFYVHLRNRGYTAVRDNSKFHYDRREDLLRCIGNELAWNSPYAGTIRKENERLATEISAMKNARERESVHVRELEKQSREQEIKISELERQLQEKEVEKSNLESSVADLVASTSWRITAPLRAISMATKRRKP